MGDRKEGTMKAPTKHWTHDAIGVCTGIAGLALLIAIVSAGDAIGLGVGALIGGGCAFGVLACGFEGAGSRRRDKRGAQKRGGPPPSPTPAAGIPPTAHFVDAP